MRARFVNEKFSDDEYSDPIKDMGIGIYSPRTFENKHQLYVFLYDIMPGMFHVKNTIDLVAKSPLLYFKGNVVKELKKYIQEYIKIENDDGWWSFDIPSFKKYVILRSKKEHVNEKFVEGGDPIKQMGIGAFTKKFIQREIKKMRGKVDEDTILEVVADLAQEEFGGAFEIYLSFEDQEEFYWLYKLLGKKRIKVVGYSTDDDKVPARYSYDYRDKQTWLYDKKVQPWINKGWEEWHNEENGDYTECILVKYDK
jgi:hypothetical protein